MKDILQVTVIRGKDIPYLPASHEDPVDPGVLKRVLYTKNDVPAGRIQMINWAVIPGRKSFRPHYHEDMDEIFVITTGTVSMTAGGKVFALRAGDAVRIPAGCIHSMTNPFRRNVTYLVIGISFGRNGRTITLP